jgi:predicted Zn-dependent protease
MSDKGLFYDSIAEPPLSCDLVLINDSLYIYLHNEKKSLLIWNLKRFNSCELADPLLRITYGNSDQTLECTGSIAQQIYSAWAVNMGLIAAEPKNHRSIILISILGLGICILLWVYFVPWLGETSASFVPVSLEIEMGKNLSETFKGENKTNDSATYYANKFIGQLDLDDTYPLHAEILESDEINAFALPGGNIFIYSGIIEKMNSCEELVALLGHEVTHVSNRHSLKSIFRTAASGIVISAFIGDASGMSSALLSQINQFKQLDYSRDLETEADNNGVEIMLQNKVDPKGMLDLLKLLKEEGREMPQYMKYLSTHPDTDSRIANISSNPEVKKVFPSNSVLERLFRSIKRNIPRSKR